MPLQRLAHPAAIALLVAFLVLAVGGGTRFVIGLTLKPIDAELGGGRGTLGSAVALFLFVSAVFMFISGRLADRFSLRLVLAAGVLVAGVGIALMAFATATWQIVVLFGGLYAVGNGLANIGPIAVMLARLFPGRTGVANAIAFSGMSAGQLVTIAALSVVLAGSGWRSVYVWVALAHLVLLPLVLLAVPSAEGPGQAAAEKHQATGGATLGQAMRTPHYWLLAATYALCGFQDFFVTTHVVAFAIDQGANALFAGNLLALMGLTGLVGIIVSGWWCDRYGPVWPALFSFVLRAALFALVLIDTQPATVAVFALVFGFTFLFTAPLTVVIVRQTYGVAWLGTINGSILMIHHACGGLGALLGGIVFDAAGRYDTAFAIMLATCVGAALTSLGLRWTRPS